MAKEITSWLNYIHGMQQRKFSKENFSIEDFNQLVNLNQVTSPLFNYAIPFVYLLDLTTGEYLAISNLMTNMLGHAPEGFLKKGVDFTLEIYQPQHLKIFNEEIFPDRLEMIKKIPFYEHPNYIFNHNFQFKNKKGEFINVVQRSCFIKSDENNNPLFSLGVVSNISHFETKTPITQVIEKTNSPNTFNGIETVFKKSYFLKKEDSLFTKREKELLPLLADGLCSKEIADKLCISEYTVINHRRNMMLKTNSHNVTQLVSYALKNCIF